MTTIILIDDEKLNHLGWSHFCSKRGLEFKGFYCVDSFLNEARDFDINSLIYIDSNLKNGLLGEIESEKIFKLGFSNLYLTTGYRKEDISKPSWIKEVYSKSPENILLAP